MGTWSTSITDDDMVADVMGEVSDRLKQGAAMADASSAARRKFKSMLKDADDGPSVWLGLAAIQWKHGRVEPEVLRQVQSFVREGRGLDRWHEDPKALAKRREVLARFAEQISHPNESPKPLPKLVVRAAPFQAGDCLAVQVGDNRFTAALVLAADNSHPEHGKNLVASLDYLSVRPPALTDFERCPPLRKVHGHWQGQQDLLWCLPVGFKKERQRFQLIGHLAADELDVPRCSVFGSWRSVGEQIVLNRLHLGLPDD